MATVPAQADVRSYCEAYARDQADAHLSGGAILGAKPKPTAEEREERNMLAMGDCLALYTPKLRIEPVTAKPETITVKPITTTPAKLKPPVAPKPKRKAVTAATPPHIDSATPTARTPAWKDYCAAKHPSYNRKTDTYTSLSGKQRPCVATKSLAPLPTKSLTPLLTKSLAPLPTKSLAPPPSDDESPWKTFDQPITLSR
ncbi:MAG: BA14K family protein [Rhizobiales bacterium]|nr:BA14K family protein [Hyphomicrobiales bacterium]